MPIFRADDDGGAFALAVLLVFALGGDQRAAGPGFQRGERQALVLARVLHAGGAEVVEDGGGEVGVRFRNAERVTRRGGFAGFLLDCREQGCVVFAGGEDAVGRERFHCEGAGDADGVALRVGAIVEVLGVGVASYGSVDFLLALVARLARTFLAQLGLFPTPYQEVCGEPAIPRMWLSVPSFSERERFAECWLPLGMDDVDLGVVDY